MAEHHTTRGKPHRNSRTHRKKQLSNSGHTHTLKLKIMAKRRMHRRRQT